MWPLLSMIYRRSPYITLPFAAVIGFIGYTVEGWISDRYTPGSDSIIQQRDERLLANLDFNTSPGKHNPLEVNRSSSLSS